MNATTATANQNINNAKMKVHTFIFLIISYFIYVFNYRRWSAYIDGLVKKYNTKEFSENENNVKEDDAILDTNLWYDLPNDNDDKYSRVRRYKGEWKNGEPNGNGIMKFIHNDKNLSSTLECTFVDGRANGYGRQIFERTYEKMVPYYEGEIKNNFQHGKGEYYYGNGSYYKGEFVDGKFQGQGIEYCHIKHQTFVGEFYNDGQLKGEWKYGRVEN
jgi:hypothetical protein